MSAHRILSDLYRAPFLVRSTTDGETLTVKQYGVNFQVITAGASETRILDAPSKGGLRCKVVHDTDGGDFTLTVNPTSGTCYGYNQSNSTTMAFADAGDWAEFESIEIGSEKVWRIASGSEGLVESLIDSMDIHALTALSAVPSTDDLVPISDESTSGDPARAVTVTELLTAAGDMTDLAAVPDVDDRILLTDESATGDPAKSTTTANLLSVAGDLTDLGAVPAVDDRILLTDESAEGDPAKSTTTANLLSLAGDLTDLAAAPALDDRLLVTDEDVAGDPAKSMSVQNLLDARATAVNTTGVGAKNGASVAVAETGVPGHLMKTVLTCTATPCTFGDETSQGQYGGVKVYDFPAGLIFFMGALVEGNVTLTAPAIDNWGGDVGLGVEAPTDHQDATNKTGLVMNTNAVSAGAADKIGVVDAKTVADALTESGARHLDGTGTPVDLYLNFLVDDNEAHDNTITGAFTGTITFFWLNLGDLT